MMCTTKMLPLMMLTVMFLQPSYAQAVPTTNLCTYHMFPDSPTVTILNDVINVVQGNSVTLDCTVSSNLALTSVYWQRNTNGAITTINPTINNPNNKYSGSTTSNPALTIFNADIVDAGDYTCFAVSSAGTGQSNIVTRLTVLAQTPPTVTVLQPSYSITVGNSVTLECTVTSVLPVTSVQWQKNVGGTITTITSTTPPTVTVLQPSYSITVGDSVTLECTVTSVLTVTSVQWQRNVGGVITTITSTTPPTVTVLQPSYSITVGDSVTLECTVTSVLPVTSVQWQRNVGGLVVKYSGSTVNNPSLTITNTDTTDSANYVCTATNSVGTGTSSQTSLSVTGSIPVVQIPQPSYTVNLAQTITITCTVTANPTHTSVQWQRTQNGVTTNIGVGSGKYSGGTVNSPSLSINNADLNDIGQYVCSATNIVGTGTSTATTLNVVGDVPSVLIEKAQYSVWIGNTVTLACTVTANPSHTTVYWKRVINGALTDITVTNNNKYSGSTVSSPSLTIFNVDNSDEGNYICYADNSVGTGQSSQSFLDVFGSIPVVQIQQSSYTVNLAQTITITCTVTANPTYTSVQWQRTQNGVTTNIGVGSGKYSGGTVNSPSLSINNADLNDIGQYVCSATNIVGTGSSAATT
ncbi:HMCN [Mytilus edulis]|uniref:HMCN n=1 Tax=Mytilus edulis TaxID=6550 RepID=A0A8S3VAW8_MYTED|nr:HMCN [Mytilus edulis]